MHRVAQDYLTGEKTKNIRHQGVNGKDRKKGGKDRVHWKLASKKKRVQNSREDGL